MSDKPVILITGASSGFGEASAKLFASKDYRVVMAARRLDRLQALEQDIMTKGGEAFAVQADMGKLEDIQRLAEQALAKFRQVDVLFNNAGFGRLNWLQQLNPIEDIQAQMQVDLLGAIWLTQAVLPHMISRRSGHIINMASMAGFVATPTYTVYAACKFGMRGFSEALRREVSIHGIYVSLISPGGAKTEFGAKAKIQRKTGLSTPGWLRLTAEDVAQTVYKVAQRPRRLIIVPGTMRLGLWINTLFPGLFDWSTRKYFVEPELR